MNTGAFIHDLLDWIDNNLDSRLDIETVSRRAGYSKWHLQRIFKEHTGSPLAEYIRAQKLQKSVERLAQSDEPILNVAIALGFDSQQSFNRSFKRQYGQAPGAWRRSIGCRGSRQMSQKFTSRSDITYKRKTLCKQRVLSVLPAYNFAGKVMGLLPLDRRRWLAADVIHHAGNAVHFVDDAVRHAA